MSIQDAYAEHKGVLIAYMSQYVLKPEDVEDILQETFLKSLEASRKSAINSPKSYLFIVARNLIFKRLKRKSRDMMREISSIDEQYLKSNDVPADVNLHQKRKMEAFIAVTNQLPPQSRRVFLMRKLLGMSQLEISQELGISKSTVERHITNAIKKCELLMADKGYSVGRAAQAGSLVALNRGKSGE